MKMQKLIQSNQKIGFKVENEENLLSEIIPIINERFTTDLVMSIL